MDLIAAFGTFVRVAETGSFSAVANERGVTQPAVSRLISALEEHLATRLVHRTTHAVTLTDDGLEVLESARQLLDQAEALRTRTGKRREKPVGKVRLSTPVAFGLHVAGHIGRLLDRHEELSVELLLHDRTSNLVEEGIDLEVRIGPVVDASLVARKLGATAAVLVATPDYLDRHGRPAHPRELADHDCIAYPRWGEDDVLWFTGPEGLFSVPIHGRFRTNSAGAARRAALAGLGVVVLSHILIGDDIRTGRFEVLMPDYPTRRFPFYVVYPSRRNLPPRTRVVIEFLSDLVAAHLQEIGVERCPISEVTSNMSPA